ncbi:MAG: trehalose-phosphatase [Thermoleophilia bacterium]
MDDLVLRGADRLAACIRVSALDPRRTALFCDLEGTLLAPKLPDEAAVSARLHDLLGEIRDRVGLLTITSSGSLTATRALLRLDGVTYVTTYGLEEMSSDGTVTSDPLAERYVADVAAMRALAETELADAHLGVIVEDKRVIVALHYETARDPAITRHAIVTRVVESARARGLAVIPGHRVVEIGPPLSHGTGTAIRRLLRANDYRAAWVFGDSLADLAGFRALHDWAEIDRRRGACAVAAVTAETPSPVRDDADALVATAAGVEDVLIRLRRAVAAR